MLGRRGGRARRVLLVGRVRWRRRRVDRGRDDDARRRVENLRIIFPEGLNVREMGDRVAAVRKIAIAKRGVTPRLTRAAVPRGRQARPAAEGFLADWKRGSLEGFLFPALYEFTQYTNGSELVADQLAAFRQELRAASTSATPARRT